MFKEAFDNLRRLYCEDSRPWIIGYSGGKDSTMLASLAFDVIGKIPLAERKKEVAVVCTDTRVEIPAIVEMVTGQLARMRAFSSKNNLNIEAHLLKPPASDSFWVNIIGRGYPPPNRTFRWCTQRMKIDPVSDFIKKRLGHWGEAIILLGARSSESSARAQTLAKREKRGLGLRKHDDLPRCWISAPIEDLTTQDVWAYLLQKPNPWGGDNRDLFKLYSNASGGECPLVVDQLSPSCGNSRFGCWTCTVVENDKASEGLLASGDERMEALLDFRSTLIEFRDPNNGYRDSHRKNGQEAPGPLLLSSRKELLKRLLALQVETGFEVISSEELLLIQKHWNSARDPDDGKGVAKICNATKGIVMPKEPDKSALRELEERVTEENKISVDTLRRMLSCVSEYGESHRAMGLPEELLQILQDDLRSDRFKLN